LPRLELLPDPPELLGLEDPELLEGVALPLLGELLRSIVRGGDDGRDGGL